MTRIIAGLERSGLAKRVPDSSDARRVRIHATPAGTRLLQRGRKMRTEYLAKQLDGLSGEDLAAVDEAVEILARVLQDWK
jgi:DNA-binding MarR family transcriptional regulator